jgi:hypothetical protein
MCCVCVKFLSCRKEIICEAIRKSQLEVCCANFTQAIKTTRTHKVGLQENWVMVKGVLWDSKAGVRGDGNIVLPQYSTDLSAGSPGVPTRCPPWMAEHVLGKPPCPWHRCPSPSCGSDALPHPPARTPWLPSTTTGPRSSHSTASDLHIRNEHQSFIRHSSSNIQPFCHTADFIASFQYLYLTQTAKNVLHFYHIYQT